MVFVVVIFKFVVFFVVFLVVVFLVVVFSILFVSPLLGPGVLMFVLFSIDSDVDSDDDMSQAGRLNCSTIA